MNTVDRKIFPLWDYGWLDYSEVLLPKVHVPSDAPRAYFQSEDFGTSFVGPKRDLFADLHGPFRRDSLAQEDFQLLTPEEFCDRIAAIRQPEGFSAPASDEQWHPIEKLVADLSARSSLLFALRFTEKDRDRFHEWGSVLDVFREFICVAPSLSAVDRLVFGYD